MRFPALRHAGFRNYLLGSFVSNVGTGVQSLAIAWHIYQITGQSFMVGLLGLVRVVPLLSLTLIGGVLADQTDRRKTMLLTQSGMALVSLLAFVLTVTGNASVAALYGIVALHAVARAFDGPARQAMFVGLVPKRDFPNAASLNGMGWRLSDVLGPILMAAIVEGVELGAVSGVAFCYGLNFVTYFAVLLAVFRLPASRPQEEGERARSMGEVVGKIKEGWRFVNRTPVVRHAMWIDFWATLFSGADSLLPAFAASILHLGPSGYGILSASAAAGALIAATGLSWLPTVHRQGRLVILMIGVYGLATIGLGFSHALWMACLSLGLIGASDMTSTVMRQTIRQLATPDAMRGRMNATCSLFHISGPQLGDFEAGAAAALWGERASIVLGGGLCVGVAMLWSRAKALAGYVHRHDQELETTLAQEASETQLPSASTGSPGP